MSKRSSLFGLAPKAADPVAKIVDPEPPAPLPAAPAPTLADPQGRKYPVAASRQGKRVATVYLEPEALRQLQKIAFDEETTIQALLSEGVNAVFQARGLSRIA
jgi:hypothetical protein